MARDRRIDDQDLTEADRIIIGLYDRTREPIAWDESDDAILSYAREVRAAGPGAAGTDGGEGTASPTDGDGDNVVPFAPRGRGLLGRVIHSPATGFAMAASLMIGVFAGQGLSPYLDLGVAPGYQDLKERNERLSREVATGTGVRTRSIQVEPGAPGAATSAESAGVSLASLSETLGGYECANLSAAVSADRRVRITGFVSTTQELRQLSRRLSGLPRRMEVVNQARVLGWPYCRALDLLIRAGGAHSPSERLPVVRPYDHGAEYVEGQNLVVEAAATTLYDGHIYVDLIQHDGSVVHLLWSPERLGREAAAGQQVLLGTAGATFTIVPPFGTEMLVVVSSPVRLFDTPRPQVEKAEEYLKALEDAVAKVPFADPERQVVSNYHFIETGPAR